MPWLGILLVGIIWGGGGAEGAQVPSLLRKSKLKAKLGYQKAEVIIVDHERTCTNNPN